jgi:hypothetical protein
MKRKKCYSCLEALSPKCFSKGSTRCKECVANRIQIQVSRDPESRKRDGLELGGINRKVKMQSNNFTTAEISLRLLQHLPKLSADRAVLLSKLAPAEVCELIQRIAQTGLDEATVSAAG